MVLAIYKCLLWRSNSEAAFLSEERLLSLSKKKAAFVLSDHSLSFCNLSKSPFSCMEYNRLKTPQGIFVLNWFFRYLFFLVILNESRNPLVLAKNFSSLLCFPPVFPCSLSWLRDIMIKNSHHAHLPVCPVLCHLAVGYQSIIINVLWKLSRLDMQFRWKTITLC